MHFEASIKGLDKLLAINKKMVTSAARAAIDKTARAMRKEIPLGIRKRYAIPPKQKTQMRITPGLTKTTPTKLQARVFIRDKRNLLYPFQAKKTKKGVTVKVIKGPRKVVKRGFIATMASGHIGLFKRHGNLEPVPYTGKYRKGKSRLTQPIHELATASTPRMTIANLKKLKSMESELPNRFRKELQKRMMKINARK